VEEGEGSLSEIAIFNQPLPTITTIFEELRVQFDFAQIDVKLIRSIARTKHDDSLGMISDHSNLNQDVKRSFK